MNDWHDPNTWPAPDVCHVYSDTREGAYSIVDAIDFPWVTRWLWSVKYSRGEKKFYLRRNMQTGSGREGRTQHTRFLRTEIMLRTGIKPPTPEHKLVDHRDGDGMNCRRSNLRWATHSMNVTNARGSHAHDVVEG